MKNQTRGLTETNLKSQHLTLFTEQQPFGLEKDKMEEPTLSRVLPPTCNMQAVADLGFSFEWGIRWSVENVNIFLEYKVSFPCA